jgi:hypothetical protein
MKITDLEPHEQHVLGGLVRMMIRSDGDFTEAEEEKVNSIGAELGGDVPIWRVISASAQEHPSEEEIRAAVPSVVRPEVRELILSVIERVAGSDGVADDEEDLLAWVRGRWG